MRTINLLLFFSFLFLACNSERELKKDKRSSVSIDGNKKNVLLLFEPEREIDKNKYKEGVLGSISIFDNEEQMKHLIDKDAIILESNRAVLKIDYPLRDTIKVEIQSESKRGFTKGDLIIKISEEYARIYQEEEASLPGMSIEERERRLVMEQEEIGKYGIWNYELDDLSIMSLTIYGFNEEKPLIEFMIP